MQDIILDTKVVLKPIPTLIDKYKAGSDGKVYSNYRGSWNPLSPSKTASGKGYYSVNVVLVDQGRKSRMVHQLICMAFHGLKPTERSTVSHKDGDKYNNLPENLEWASYKDNLSMKLVHNTHDSGCSNTRSIFDKEKLFIIRWLLINTEMTHQQIGDIMNSRPQNISRIASETRYGNIEVWVEEKVKDDKIEEILERF